MAHSSSSRPDEPRLWGWVGERPATRRQPTQRTPSPEPPEQPARSGGALRTSTARSHEDSTPSPPLRRRYDRCGSVVSSRTRSKRCRRRGRRRRRRWRRPRARTRADTRSRGTGTCSIDCVRVRVRVVVRARRAIVTPRRSITRVRERRGAHARSPPRAAMRANPMQWAVAVGGGGGDREVRGKRDER